MVKSTRRMSLILAIFCILTMIGFGYFYSKANYTSVQNQDTRALWKDMKIEQMKIEGKVMNLVVAETPVQWSQGLMYVRKPVRGFDGMVFRFNDLSEVKMFWNQNTFVDLTLYWIDKGKVIGTSELPSIEKSKEIVTVQSPGPVDTVVEFIK